METISDGTMAAIAGLAAGTALGLAAPYNQTLSAVVRAREAAF